MNEARRRGRFQSNCGDRSSLGVALEVKVGQLQLELLKEGGYILGTTTTRSRSMGAISADLTLTVS